MTERLEIKFKQLFENVKVKLLNWKGKIEEVVIYL